MNESNTPSHCLRSRKDRSQSKKRLQSLQQKQSDKGSQSEKPGKSEKAEKQRSQKNDLSKPVHAEQSKSPRKSNGKSEQEQQMENLQISERDKLEKMTMDEIFEEYDKCKRLDRSDDANMVKAYKAYIIKNITEGNQAKADLERIRAGLEEEKETREHQAEEIIIEQRELAEARVKLANMEKLVEELKSVQARKNEIEEELRLIKAKKLKPCAIRQKIEDNINRLLANKNEDPKSEKLTIKNEIIEGFHSLMELVEQINEERENWKTECIEHRKYLEGNKKQIDILAELKETMTFILGQHGTFLKSELKKQKQEIEAIQESLKKSPLLQTPKQKADMRRNDKEREQMFSYAQMAQFPPLPTEKPTLILSPKTDGIQVQELRNVLNTEVDQRKLPTANCIPTRSGKFLITCNNDEELAQIRTSLQTSEKLNHMINITEKAPKMLRVIVFGAPEAPMKLRIDNKSENRDKQKENDEAIQNYEKNIIIPALNKCLRKDDVSFKLLKVMKGRRGEATSHLVLQMHERDALQLQSLKPCFGFNRCTVKPYILIPRCFNCQKLGHVSRNCTNELTCAYCSENHHVNECTAKEPKCINCIQENRCGEAPGKDIPTNHTCFDGRCPTYIKQQREAVAQRTLRLHKIPCDTM